MKKFLAALLALSMLAGIAACSSGGTASTTSQPQEQSQQESSEQQGNEKDQITLRFSWWGAENRHKATLAVMDKFMEKNPNVKMEGEYGGFSGWYEKLMTQMAAGTGPDIFQVDPAWVFTMSSVYDQVVDYFNQDIVDLSIFEGNEVLYEYATYDGKLIGVPSGMNGMCLFGNKQVFDQAGIDYTNDPYFTWDRLFEESKKVRALGDDMYLMSTPFVGRYVFPMYLVNQCGDFMIHDDYTIGFTEENVRDTFAFVQRLYDEEVMQPLDQVVAVTNDIEMPGWAEGKIAMFPNNPGTTFGSVISTIGEENMLMLPQLGDINAENTGIMYRATNFLACLDNEKADYSLSFVNFMLTDPEAYQELGIVRSVPVVKEHLDYVLEQDMFPNGFMDVIDWAAEHKGGEGFNPISDDVYYETLATEMVAKVYYGEYTPEQAAKEFVSVVENYLAGLKAKS